MAATNPAMMDVMTNSIFIIAHAPLASALRQCVLHVFPDDVSAVVAFDVQPDSPPEVTLTEAAQAFKPSRCSANLGAGGPVWCDPMQRGSKAGGRRAVPH
jgi:hypothetical protein